VLGGINAVFGQPARFDVAIEEHNAHARIGEFARSKQACGACADDGDKVLILC
jgi:hypothetical protein